ncbi:MAG: hypothetical protein K0S39_93 [Paenibacillus sp.]|jgi:hypothetical protein|nr:hypothetical protein [Paenibacillus sp.]
MMNANKFFAALFAALLLVSAITTEATAAATEITASIQSSLDKTIADSDPAQADKIRSQYNEFLALRKQGEDLDVQIKTLHSNNKETLSGLSKQIKQIDEAKLDELEAAVSLTRERYKPLFSHYTTLNKQITAARMMKNKELSSLLRFKAGLLKITVKLARIDIEAKEDALKAAKTLTAQTVKKIRSNLTDIEPLNTQIKAKQSAVRTIETSVTPVWNTFKQGVKKKDAKSVLDTLKSLVSLSREINEEKQKVFNLETEISGILSAVKAQFP